MVGGPGETRTCDLTVMSGVFERKEAKILAFLIISVDFCSMQFQRVRQSSACHARVTRFLEPIDLQHSLITKGTIQPFGPGGTEIFGTAACHDYVCYRSRAPDLQPLDVAA